MRISGTRAAVATAFATLVATFTVVLTPTVALAAPPANDDFADAEVIAAPGITFGTNVDATVETGEPIRHITDDIVDYDPATSVWYRWTSPDVAAPAEMLLSTRGSDFDTVVAVYTGGPTVADLTEVAADDDFDQASGPSRLRFQPAQDTVYYIAVDGVSMATGSIRLRLSEISGQGSIDGFVTAPGGGGVDGFCVIAVDDTGEQVSTLGHTDPAGEYIVNSVEAGTDRHLKFWNCTGATTYAGEFNGDAQTLAAAPDIPITDGQTLHINATVAQGGSISGTVSADDAGTPSSLADICVRATMVGDPDDGFARQTKTNGMGQYTIPGLDGGQYLVRFGGDCAPNGEFAAEYYDDAQDVADADLVVVTEGVGAGSVDAGLGAAPGTISGTVRGWGNTAPGIPNICVRAVGPSYTSPTVFTNANGDYTIPNVPPGTNHIVRFSDCNTVVDPLTTQWFNRALTVGEADAINVTSGHTTPSIDANMFHVADIGGHVTDSAGGARAGVCVDVYESEGSLVRSTTTAVDGGWTVPVAPGNYEVHFGCEPGTDPFQHLWWHSRTSQAAADDVFVDQGDQVTDVDQLLPDDGLITGRVSNGGGAPLSDICVTAYEDDTSVVAAQDETDAYGFFDLGVAAGDYDVQYLDCSSLYFEQWFDGKPDQATADTIAVSTGSTVRASATLARSGTISGLITDENDQPVSGICVSTYDSNGDQLDNEIENRPNGTYTVGGMGTGTYRVEYEDCTSTTYGTEFYDNKLDLGSATGVSVTLGADKPGINVTLQSQAPTNVVLPAVGGTAQVGVTLHADKGQWDHSPSTYEYQWYSCDPTGVTCTPSNVDGDRYFVTPADVGRRIRVDVTATNSVGDATASSPLTDAVGSGPPENDDIDDRTVLSGSLPYEITGTNVDATREPGEPAHDGYTDGASVWYEWTAPTGTSAIDMAELNLSASDFLPTISVYDGSPSPFSGLHLVAEDDFSLALTKTVEFAPVPGTTYYIAIDGYPDPFNSRVEEGTIKMTLSAVSGISGTVTDSTTGDPIRDICVSASGSTDNSAVTAGDGTFFVALPQGNYILDYAECAVGPAEYAQQWYDGASVVDDATPVHVSAETVTTGKDAELTRLAAFGSISGTVTNEDGDLLPNICVTAYLPGSGWAGADYTDGNGNYLIRGLGDPGQPEDAVDYAVDFTDCSHFYGYEYYDNKLDDTSADLVSVRADETTADIDAVLQHDPPANTSVPTINGRANVGVQLRATNGTWDHEPSVFTFQWYRCAADGTGCAPADDGDQRTYVLAPGDEGHRFMVEVTAENSVGTGTEDSAVTGVVGAPAPPPNDDIADRQELVGSVPLEVTGDNLNATAEVGEPAHDGFPAAASVWYEWTAPTGPGAVDWVTVTLAGSSFDTVLSVYDGAATPFSALHLVAENDDSGGLPSSAAAFAPVPGTTYFIAVDGYPQFGGGAATGSIDLRVEPATGIAGTVEDASGDPIADICVTATDDPTSGPSGPDFETGVDGTFFIPLPPGTWYVDYYDCTGQYEEQWYDGETDPADATPVSVVQGTVVTGVDATMVELVPFGSISGSVTNEAGDPIPDICVNVDSSSGRGDSTSTDANGRYRMRGLGDPDYPDERVDYLVEFSDCSGVYGDEFYDNKLDPFDADPVSVSLGRHVRGIDAVLQSDPPVNTAPPTIAGRARVGGLLKASNGVWDHEPSAFTFQWYRCDASGSPCAAADDGQDRRYRLVPADEGFRFIVEVTAENSKGTDTAESSLSDVVDTGAPANDDIADRQVLTGSVPIVVTGDNVDATREPGEPDHLGYIEGASVWYEWTAPSSGLPDVVTIDLAASSFDTTLSIYDGTPTPFSRLHLVAENDDLDGSEDTSVASWAPVAGTTYYIAVDGYVDDTTHAIDMGSIGLRLEAATGVSGTVEDEDGQPIRDICVTATQTPEAEPDGPQTNTASDGTYFLDLAPGTWYVDFFDCVEQYEEQWYDGETDPEDATPITVTDGVVTEDVDATMVELAPFGSISGVVTNEAGQPIPGICVLAVDTTYTSYGQACTDGDGTYEVRGLGDPDNPTVHLDYIVAFQDCGCFYGSEFYDNQIDLDDADLVAVEMDQDVTGIDATMQSEAPVNTTLPTITGSTASIGNTLTAGHGAWQHEPSLYDYQWLRCTAAGINCVAIPGADSQTYETTSDDAGLRLRLDLTASNSIGDTSARSFATAMVGAPTDLTSPTITGQIAVGSQLTASQGTWTETGISYAYQWLRCDTAALNCVPIGGAQTNTYTLVNGDLGKRLRVEVTATNTNGNAAARSFATTVVGAPANVTLPAITGPAEVGSQLTASQGTWTGTGISYAYQWLRCDTAGLNCVPIGGAQTNTYTLVNADSVKRIRVDVTATNIDGDATARTFATAVVGAPANVTLPAITGQAEVGSQLAASQGTWTGTGITYTSQWLRCDSAGANCLPIAGAQTSTYTVANADLGKRLRVEVTATNANGNSAARSFATAAVGAPANVTLPAITGQAQVGSELTASAGTWTGLGITYTYQWLRCDTAAANCVPIGGAQTNTYTLANADNAKRIRVEVTATNTNGTTAARSFATTAVGAPVLTGDVSSRPKITGDLSVGSDLFASQGGWSGAALSYSYRWLRCDTAAINCDPIDGAHTSTYTVDSADLGKRLRVEVTATNAQGDRTELSFATAVVGAPAYTVLPSISGQTTVGSILTASQGTWSGSSISYAIQWLRCDAAATNCVPIDGAQTSTYAVDNADVGKRIRVDVTGTNTYGSVTARSFATTTLG